MKKIFLYLFVFSVLMHVFTYMYFSKKIKYEQKKNSKKEQKQAIIDSLERVVFDMSHYTLGGNYAAQDYVERYFANHKIDKIKDSILNHTQIANKIVGYDFPDNPLFISRLEFLNHRWILADFDNSQLGGQVLLRYSLNEDGTFTFEAIDRAMYLPKPTYNQD